MEGSCHCPLPEHVIFYILLWLPVKSLLRFESVCKNWLAMIKSPYFINEHSRQKSNHTSLVAYWSGYDRSNPVGNPINAFTFLLDETLEKYEEPNHLKISPFVSNIRGPCNGLFCIRTNTDHLALWNPATKRMRPLPDCPKIFQDVDDFGFGIDPLTDELKVIIVEGGLYDFGLRPYFAVYSSGNDSWRFVEKEDHLDCDMFFVSTRPCVNTFLNGFYYWWRFDFTTRTSVVLEFDMHEEVFAQIKIPDNVGSNPEIILYLYNDSLALFDCNRTVDDKRVNLWTMKEKGCWTKLFTVTLPFKYHCPLGFWKNDTKIFFSSKLSLSSNHEARELILFDVDSHDTKSLKIEKGGAVFDDVLLFYYTESLASVKGRDGFQDYDIDSTESREFFIREERLTWD